MPMITFQLQNFALWSLIFEFLTEKAIGHTKTLHEYCGMSCRLSGAQVRQMLSLMWNYIYGKLGGRFHRVKTHQNIEITENRARIHLRYLWIAKLMSVYHWHVKWQNKYLTKSLILVFYYLSSFSFSFCLSSFLQYRIR